MAYSEIGEQLRRWRNYSGLSQALLEDKAALGHNTVSRIERGENNPNTKTVNMLAGALKISHEQLIFGSPPDENEVSKIDSHKELMIKELEKLTESECRELYPVLEKLVRFAKKN